MVVSITATVNGIATVVGIAVAGGTRVVHRAGRADSGGGKRNPFWCGRGLRGTEPMGSETENKRGQKIEIRGLSRIGSLDWAFVTLGLNNSNSNEKLNTL